MTLANLGPEANAAIALLFGTDEEAAVAAEAASPIAQAVAAAAQPLQHIYEGELESKRLAEAMQLVLGNGVALHLDSSIVQEFPFIAMFVTQNSINHCIY